MDPLNLAVEKSVPWIGSGKRRAETSPLKYPVPSQDLSLLDSSWLEAEPPTNGEAGGNIRCSTFGVRMPGLVSEQPTAPLKHGFTQLPWLLSALDAEPSE